jgi:hypothetical protein
MIQATPGKERYQVLLDHDRPGHFSFNAAFADDLAATKHAERLHAEYGYADVVVLDAKDGTLRLTLPGKRSQYPNP